MNLTPIIKNPKFINTLNEDECEYLSAPFARKRIPDPELKEVVHLIRSRLKSFDTLRGREEAARRDVVKLQESLGRIYDFVGDAWRRINRIHDKEPQNVAKEIKAAGRPVGLMVNDLPAVLTQMYTVEALRNIIRYKSINHNTAQICDEHFWSLYTYGGPKIVELAFSHQRDWNIAHLVQDVYGYNQTAKTTKEENYRLAEHHKNYDLVTPQESYTAAEVSPLVYCPKPMESKVMMMWRFMHEMVDLDYVRSPHKPFDECLMLDEAIELYPDLKDIRKYLKVE
jgi:hypothetical protein